MAMKCCTKLETAKERYPFVFQGHLSNFKVTRYKTSQIFTQIGRFWTIGRSQLSNPSDLPCFFLSITFHYFQYCPLIFQFISGPKIIIYFIVNNRARPKGQPDSSLGQPDFSQQVARWAPWFFFELLKPACSMMLSSNGNIFHVTGPLCGEFTSHWWIPLTKASDMELWCFLWSTPEQTVE